MIIRKRLTILFFSVVFLLSTVGNADAAQTTIGSYFENIFQNVEKYDELLKFKEGETVIPYKSNGDSYKLAKEKKLKLAIEKEYTDESGVKGYVRVLLEPKHYSQRHSFSNFAIGKKINGSGFSYDLGDNKVLFKTTVSTFEEDFEENSHLNEVILVDTTLDKAYELNLKTTAVENGKATFTVTTKIYTINMNKTDDYFTLKNAVKTGEQSTTTFVKDVDYLRDYFHYQPLTYSVATNNKISSTRGVPLFELLAQFEKPRWESYSNDLWRTDNSKLTKLSADVIMPAELVNQLNNYLIPKQSK